MEFTTTRQFAAEQGVSYEAIRKQLIRYSAELEGHIVRKGRVKLLDQYAVDFLSNRRRENPVILQSQDKSAEIQELRQQIDTLKNALLESQQKVIALHEAEAAAIESKARYTALIEMHDQTENKLKAAEETITDLQSRLHDAETEASRYQKSIFGFYRKR